MNKIKQAEANQLVITSSNSNPTIPETKVSKPTNDSDENGHRTRRRGRKMSDSDRNDSICLPELVKTSSDSTLNFIHHTHKKGSRRLEGLSLMKYPVAKKPVKPGSEDALKNSRFGVNGDVLAEALWKVYNAQFL
jgi:hypothetical protein